MSLEDHSQTTVILLPLTERRERSEMEHPVEVSACFALIPGLTHFYRRSNTTRHPGFPLNKVQKAEFLLLLLLLFGKRVFLKSTDNVDAPRSDVQDFEFWFCWVKFKCCTFGSENVHSNTGFEQKFHRLEALGEGTCTGKTR